jgi:hypothetical protein
MGEQLRPAWFCGFGQQIPERLFQRFVLRGRPGFQPIENTIFDISNYDLSQADAPLEVTAGVISLCSGSNWSSLLRSGI